MARRRWYRGRAVVPSDQQSRHGGCLATYLPIGRLTRPAPVLMARCFRGIRCDPSLPLRRQGAPVHVRCCCRSVADFGNPTFIECSQLNRRSPCRFGKSNGGASLAIPMKCIRSDGCGYRRDFSGSIIQIVRLRRLRGWVKARTGSGVDVVFQPPQVSSRSLHCRAKERFHGKTRTENHARRNARIRRSRAADLLL
jgi:hypothetical protein